jgi:hypothetical protein
MKGRGAPDIIQMPSPPVATPEQILLYGKRQSRLIHLEANVIGYFGHIFREKLSSRTVTRSITAAGVSRTLPL